MKKLGSSASFHAVITDADNEKILEVINDYISMVKNRVERMNILREDG